MAARRDPVRFSDLADPGLLKAFDASGRTSVGHTLEMIVQNELERRGAELGYVRTADGLEVGFLSRHPAAGEGLVQVCADASAPETLSSELRAQVDGVVVQSACEWLLADPDAAS